MTERGIGDNGGPALAVDRTFKKRWAFALFARPDKPAGAVAMGFKIYMEMDSQGRGATISDAEFMVACGVSDGSCRNFKRWLLENEFIQILRRGYRGHRSEFLATIPGERIPAAFAAIGTELPATNAGKNACEYRQPMPASESNLPATVAAIPALAKESSPHTPLKENNKNNTLPSAAAVSVSSGCEEIDGLNGATFEITKFIASNMAVTLSEARTMLASDVQIFSADAVAAAYAKTRAEMGPGSKVTRPYKYLIEAARGIKEGHQKKHQAEPKEPMHSMVRRFAEEAEERRKKGLRP